VKIIQIDVLPEEHDHNIPSHARLVGDCKVATAALLDGFKGYKLKQTDWVAKLK
jgi:thiamine pyrophosphate-dependent acetolactate synthase large subunit-like protein